MKRINNHTAHGQMKKAKKCWIAAETDIEQLVLEGLKDTVDYLNALTDADRWHRKYLEYSARAYA